MIGLTEESSLRQFDRLADRVRQHRQGRDTKIVIVEGPDDLKTLSSVLPGVDIFPAGSKRIAVEACELLVEWNFDRFACVVDNDLYAEIVPAAIAARYYAYLESDLEAMLISLGALHDLISHLGSSQKIELSGGLDAVVTALRQNVLPVTSLRQRSSRDGWGLSFGKVDLSSKVDKESLTVKVNSYCMALLRVSNEVATVTQAQLLSAAMEQPSGPFYFRGKDVVVLAGVALRKKVGTLPHAATREPVLSAALRSAGGLRLSQCDWLAGLLSVITA